MRKFVLCVALSLCSVVAFGQMPLDGIKDIIRGKRATVGVAVVCGDRVWILSDRGKYPLMSVFKFHVGVTALNKMREENIALDSVVCMERHQLRGGTYSPLRDKYPDRRVCISFRDIIKYTIAHSDNNTCDWLIGFVGGVGRVEEYIRSLGIDRLRITATEQDMQQDISRSYDNWSTPLATAELLRKIHESDLLTGEHLEFLESVMEECSSGRDKLSAGLPAGVRFGHKTGRSARTPQGVRICDADAGVIYLPDGRKCYLVVLVKDSEETDKVNVGIMADIAAEVYDYLSGNEG